MSRDFEREIIPMARSEGLALAPWNVFAAGKLRSDAEEEKRRATGENGRLFYLDRWERNEDEIKMSRALEKVGKEVGTEHVTAGTFAFSFPTQISPVLVYSLPTHLSSCTRISHAKDPIRLPHYWWT